MGETSHINIGRTGKAVIIILLTIYTIITIIPFYFLLIRSFVPTSQSTQAHIWFPKLPKVNLDITYGGLSSYYNLDINKFNKHFGIDDYINPNYSMKKIAKKYHISPEAIKQYIRPYIRYKGFYALLNEPRFLRSLIATVILSISSLIVGGFLGVCTGSVLAKLRKKWHRVIYNLYVLQVIIPPIMIILPLYILLGIKLNLKNTYFSLFLLYIQGGAVSTMLFTSYIGAIPSELKESVDLDGGSRLTYLFKIIFPLSKTPLATYMAIYFPQFWNNLLFGRVFLDQDHLTLIPLIDSFQGTFTTNFQAVYAGLLVSLVPVLILYIAFRKLFIRAALAGALKS